MLKFGFDKQHMVHSFGRAGGLWLFWKSSSLDLEVIVSTTQTIHCSINGQRTSFSITFVYVQPHSTMKNEF
ncbi:hypothetical protein SLE2022_119940 [Rubroshorea leprosula]